MLLSSHAGLDLFEPGEDPLIFAADLTSMKCKHPLLCFDGCTCLICQLLQGLKILELSLNIGQALLQNRLPFFQLEIVEERHAGEKLRVICNLLGWKIAQIAVQQVDSALGQVIDVAIWLTFLRHHLSYDRAQFFKALERRVENLVIQRDGPAKRQLDAL